MSKSSVISGNAIDMGLLRTVMKDDITLLLQEISGSKCIVLDMSLSKSINLALEGASIFKENNVVTFTKLTSDLLQTDANAIIYICQAYEEAIHLVVESIQSLKKKSSACTFHLWVVPSVTERLIHSLQESGVYNDVDVRALKLDTIPIDTDLVSMELPDSFMDLIIRGSESVLKPMAQTLLKLQVLFGPFPTVQCIGRNARSLYTLTKSLSPSSFPLSTLPSQFARCLLIDRSVDLCSPFVTPLTYTALIHELLHLHCGQISLPGDKIGKKDPTPVTLQMTINEPLFAQLADANISLVPRSLKEKSMEIQALYNSRPRDSSCSISDLSQFVKKVGTIQDLYDSLQVHLFVANQITTVTNSTEFGMRWQREREILEGELSADSLREMLYEGCDMIDFLHYLIMFSQTNSGIKAKDFDSLRREFLLTYGFPRLPILLRLEESGLIRRREGSNNYGTVRSRMRLIRSDIDGSNQADLNYVTSGYAPLAARIVQAATLNTAPMKEIAEVVGFEYAEVNQPVCKVPSKDVILVAFIGGLSYMEVAAMRLIEKQNPNVEFVFLTTHMMRGRKELKNLVELDAL
ncbi:hypothetical protein WA588_006484 [Blastocystis sp. NMH]